MTADATDTPDLATLDLRGLKCPLPVLKTQRAIRMMKGEGQARHKDTQSDQKPAIGAIDGKRYNTSRLTILADDPASPLDFAHFCEVGGYGLEQATIRTNGTTNGSTDGTTNGTTNGTVHYRFIITLAPNTAADTAEPTPR